MHHQTGDERRARQRRVYQCREIQTIHGSLSRSPDNRRARTLQPMAVANTRHIRIRPTQDDEVTVPKDVADLLGPEAELEMGSGQVTIRRSGKLARSELSKIAKPVKTAEELLGQATRPLTDSERTALNEFLNG